MMISSLFVYIDVFKAFLTPVIAIAGAFIAHQQMLTNKQKLKIELYDRRLDVYQKTQAIITRVIGSARLGVGDASDFYRSVSEAPFLFDNKVSLYLKELFDKLVELEVSTEMLATYEKADFMSVEEKNSQKTHSAQSLASIKWIVTQRKPVEQLFKKYLNLKA